MQHLKELLIRLQTFNLRALPASACKIAAPTIAEAGIPLYFIGHETDLISDFKFENELRRLLDLSFVDLMMFNSRQVKLLLKELMRIRQQFKAFLQVFFDHYEGKTYPDCHFFHIYKPDFLFKIKLNQFFLVKNLYPPTTKILITEGFVQHLAISADVRRTYINLLINYAVSLICNEEERVLQIPENPSKPSPQITQTPAFKEGIAEKLFAIIKSYFSPHDQKLLLSLLKENQLPAFPLLFLGNGIQLVDAFKQLYEANLIVGCSKGVLADWIRISFEYLYRKQKKPFPTNYLNAIISSNAKPCQSPILDVKKQTDGSFILVPVLRTKKNYFSGN